MYNYNQEDINSVKESLIKEVKPDDGECRGLWILTMYGFMRGIIVILLNVIRVDHWNNNIEKTILVMDNSLYIFRYDFVLRKVKDVKIIPMAEVLEIKKGLITFPEKSLMPLVFDLFVYTHCLGDYFD